MNKEITLTPHGGRYHRAMIFHWASVIVSMPFLSVILLTAIVNPLWFRDSMFNCVERQVNRYTWWRN